MRALLVAGALLALFPSSAAACTALPAPSATKVPIHRFKVDERTQRTVLRVCVHGHTVELARGRFREGRRRSSGVRVGAAGAAGHRVAWITERHRGGLRTSEVTLASVGRAVRVLRRFTVQRQRAHVSAQLDVLLTRAGDLAWTAGSYDDPKGVVAVKQPGRRLRRLDIYTGRPLALEDGRTLRWLSGDTSYDFFDLHPIDCRSRSRFTPYARNDRVLLTRAIYRPNHSEVSVVRGCDLATGRDRVLIENDSNIGVASDLTLIGLDRTWAVFRQDAGDGRGWDVSTLMLADVVTDRSPVIQRGTFPIAGSPFAVTDAGRGAWIVGGTLYATGRDYDVVALDSGGALTDLHAEGDALVWTRDGVLKRVR
ncbi:hypothetical protein C8N24_0145 [Solirubrobacter pauli]|uniref:Uncharacterized protein n=1 Tax=Solirubrobacter pauli TaxID=166793 RepID=A0A660LBE8_9ACTN|nr:hypothetical protein [Solirubrobacter pauli]RKQ90344.1 hypothetical protein C8N24_0145 [Solirubrobacter pauli]